MEILLWLLPSVLVTGVAMLWVGWLGRAGRGEVDRDEAVRRMGAALERTTRVERREARRLRRGLVPEVTPRERSTGVAFRSPRPAVPAAAAAAPVQPPGQPPVQPAARPAAHTPSHTPSHSTATTPAPPPARPVPDVGDTRRTA